MHTGFFDLDDQRVQNLRNFFIEALLNSFSAVFFFMSYDNFYSCKDGCP